MNRTVAAAVAAGCVMALSACGGESDTAATSPSTASTTAGAAASGATVAVRATDFAFIGLPATAKAGTRFTLTNESNVEVHEMVAVRMPAGEVRSAADIVKDPASLGKLMGGGPPAAVIVAAPASAQPGAVVGDGSLKDPGRYLLICSIPTGADPKAYMDAAGRSAGGPPPKVAGGPPHFTQGMVGDITIA